MATFAPFSMAEVLSQAQALQGNAMRNAYFAERAREDAARAKLDDQELADAQAKREIAKQANVPTYENITETTTRREGENRTPQNYLTSVSKQTGAKYDRAKHIQLLQQAGYTGDADKLAQQQFEHWQTGLEFVKKAVPLVHDQSSLDALRTALEQGGYAHPGDLPTVWNGDAQKTLDRLAGKVNKAYGDIVNVSGIGRGQYDENRQFHVLAAEKAPSTTAPTTKEVGGVLYQWNPQTRTWEPAQRAMNPVEQNALASAVGEAATTAQEGVPGRPHTNYIAQATDQARQQAAGMTVPMAAGEIAGGEPAAIKTTKWLQSQFGVDPQRAWELYKTGVTSPEKLNEAAIKLAQGDFTRWTNAKTTQDRTALINEYRGYIVHGGQGAPAVSMSGATDESASTGRPAGPQEGERRVVNGQVYEWRNGAPVPLGGAGVGVASPAPQ